jgi:hypothetical protein
LPWEEELDLSDLLLGIINALLIDVVQARLVIDCHCELAEGILYDDKQHAVSCGYSRQAIPSFAVDIVFSRENCESSSSNV